MIDGKDLDSNCLKKHSMVPKKDPNGPKMGPKWVQKWQKSSFWARDLKFTPDICFYNWWKDLDSKLPKVTSMVPKRGPKGSKNGSKMGPKMTKIKFSARNLRFQLDIHFHKWWYDLNFKLSKFDSMLPKRVQKVQNGSEWVQNGSKMGPRITKIKFLS